MTNEIKKPNTILTANNTHHIINLNHDTYINFFYELIKTNQIEEKIKIYKFLKNKQIKAKEIIKQKLDVKYFICEIILDNNKILLVKDIPVNFLLSYGLLVGNHTKLLEFKTNISNKTYIADENLFEDLKEIIQNNMSNITKSTSTESLSESNQSHKFDKFEIDLESIKKINPEVLLKQNFKFNFKQPKIIEEIKNYNMTQKNIDLNQIHIIESNTIENFVPMIKIKHFKIAEKTKIPIISTIDDNFIKNTTINLYDINHQEELIQPFIIKTSTKTCDVYKKNNLLLYKDINQELYLNFNKQRIINQILDCKKVNFDKTKLIEQIKKMNEFQISADYGKFPLPIWKSYDEQKFIEIENENDFRDLSGVNFKIDVNFFERLFIQTPNGKKARYKKKFLKQEFESILENIDKNSSICFTSNKELIMKLLYNYNNDINEIFYIETISDNKLFQLKKKISYLCDIIIHKSISYNKKPQIKIAEGLYEVYFSSLSNTIAKDYNDYLSYPSKKQLLKESLTNATNAVNILKTIQIGYGELYFLLKIVSNLIIVLNEFDKNKSKKFEKLLYSYFGEFLIDRKNIKIDNDVLKLVKDINIINRLTKHTKVYVIFEKKILQNLLHDVIVIRQKPLYTPIIQPNIKKVYEIFKYSTDDIINQIKNCHINQIIVNDYHIMVSTKHREIELDSSYFRVYEDYEQLRQILENKWFKALVRKDSNNNNSSS